jgi:hypothetical protein
MKSIECELLKDKQIEQLYNFVKKHSTNNYNSNKTVDYNILWNIVYLRKLINRTLNYAKRSSKHKIKFDYVIFDKTEVVCYFSLTMKRQDVWELSIISEFIDDIKSNEAIMKCIITSFNSVVDKDVKLPICSLYINENARNIEKLFMAHTSYFKQIFIDELTYVEKYNVLYYLGDGSSSNEGENVVDSKNEQYVYDTLQNVYNLAKVMEEPVSKQSVRKLTVKLQTPLKIITKDIFDIQEIQNRPEFEGYDYSKIIFINSITNSLNLISKNSDLDTFIMNRYFKGSIIYNERLFNLYKYRFQYYNIEHFSKISETEKNKRNNFFNTHNFNEKEFSKFSNYIHSSINKIILNADRNTLIITNSLDDIENYKYNNIEIIWLKQQTDKQKNIEEIKKFKENIKFCFNNLEYHNQITNNIEKQIRYNKIYINIKYTNYDFAILYINILVKLPFILYTILNALKLLKKNGSFYIVLSNGYLEIPIIKKILNILLNTFKKYELINSYDYDKITIIFYDYIGNKNNKYLNIINELIKQINKFEKDEFTLDDVVSCLLSNKFYYKVDNEILKNIKITPIKKKILYDIPNIKINKTEEIQLNNFINEYNKLKNIYYNILKNNYIKIEPLIKHNNLIFYEELFKIYKNKQIILFYYMLKYKISENSQIKDIINIMLKKYKTIEHFIKINI